MEDREATVHQIPALLMVLIMQGVIIQECFSLILSHSKLPGSIHRLKQAGCFYGSVQFYSSYISSAQRLPNGNTLITEGSDGHLIEVTPEHEIVWEYINPYFKSIGGKFKSNMIYRAYRVPYEWIPQLEKPTETSIEPLDVSTFRVPGAGDKKADATAVEGIDPTQEIGLTGTSEEDEENTRIDFCVASINKGELK